MQRHVTCTECGNCATSTLQTCVEIYMPVPISIYLIVFRSSFLILIVFLHLFCLFLHFTIWSLALLLLQHPSFLPDSFSVSFLSLLPAQSCLLTLYCNLDMENVCLHSCKAIHSCTEYQGHLFPNQPKALVFPHLFDKQVTVANHALARQLTKTGCGSV